MELEPFLRTYCERAGPGLWGEPLNAVTNLAFFAAALFGWRRLRRAFPSSPPRDLSAAVALFVAVGLGSGLWHTLARPWAEVADAAPIFLLVSLLLASTLRRLFGASPRAIAGALTLFVAAHALVGLTLPPKLLYGSVFYAPGLLALVIIAAAARARRLPEARPLWGAAATFSVALVLRTIDTPLCAALPLGTHFLWHLLNAALLYRLLALLISATLAHPRLVTSARSVSLSQP